MIGEIKDTYECWVEDRSLEHDNLLIDLFETRTDDSEDRVVGYRTSIFVWDENTERDDYIADRDYLLDENGKVKRDKDEVPMMESIWFEFDKDDPLVKCITEKDWHTFDDYIINNNL